MDERWVKALQAKNISVSGRAKSGGNQMNGGNAHANKSAVRGTSNTSMRHAQPFKATGHKGGISRQGS
ncbi:hypothetical protein BLI708_09270 [Bifidobacterium imperatoris]|uniref:Uncharacterized protein n=1 Tax=Bifidobacterium imperatoris TaxID=2020965 RepID=A0A2N5IRN8_9BIFI|nr:hypothetical protein [Bifidobacterium imperatoris]PLS24616.1 hypothetical protein Tam1G_1204 [Bifidobacterium imperatoris]QSY57411.1 hypothetical protein BLI708_09270 [Bifidobacterium imperatoris]